MQKVYALSARGQREKNAGRRTLPAELGRLLDLIDGHRSKQDVLAISGRSAVTAGGLRWLEVSGYITVLDGLSSGAMPATPQSHPGALPSAPSRLGADAGIRLEPGLGRTASASAAPAPSAPAAMPSSQMAGHSVITSQPNSLPTGLSRSTASAPMRTEVDVGRILSDFMVQAIRRRLGEGGYAYRRQIERAHSLDDLLPHLNPLIDAIVQKAGADAGAEFADTAAFILHPVMRDTTLV